MRNRYYLQLIIALLLSACLAEQNNPLVITESCTDGIQNQNEENVDCGGVCTACEIPVVIPCLSQLNPNKVVLDGYPIQLTASDFSLYKDANYYRIYFYNNLREMVIYFFVDTLPTAPTQFNLVPWYDQTPEHAAIKFTNFYNYIANTGSIYLTHDSGEWTVSICPVNLTGTGHVYEFYGQLICTL
jgi:hypothetical protein